MKVLIAKANRDIFVNIHPKLKFEDSTNNTEFFKCTPKTFEKIRQGLRNKGYNPFSLMYW